MLFLTASLYAKTVLRKTNCGGSLVRITKKFVQLLLIFDHDFLFCGIKNFIHIHFEILLMSVLVWFITGY